MVPDLAVLNVGGKQVLAVVAWHKATDLDPSQTLYVSATGLTPDSTIAVPLTPSEVLLGSNQYSFDAKTGDVYMMEMSDARDDEESLEP
jgi:hypothetical protein